MLDSFVSFSGVDSFPSFKSFNKINDDEGAFTVDAQDRRDIQSVNQKSLDVSNTSPAPAFRSAQKSRTTSGHKRNTSSLTNKTMDSTTILSTLQCDICSVPITSLVQFDSHIKGKRHQAQLAATLIKDPQYKSLSYTELCARRQTTTSALPTVDKEEEKPTVSLTPVVVERILKEETISAPPLIPSKKINCSMCNVSCNSQQMFDIHIAGKKHQMKLKMNSFTRPAPLARVIPENIPPPPPPPPPSSSSNYCDICSIECNSQEEFTQHLVHKRHQTRVKEAELCAQQSAGMNINFDEFKIPESNVNSKNFDYQCTTCDKKIKGKLQLVLHIKSSLHTRRSDNQRRRETNSRGSYQATRGGVLRGGINNPTSRGGGSARGKSFSSFRGSNRSAGMSRPYRAQVPFRGHPSASFSQRPDRSSQQQILNDPFGAFQNDQPTPLFSSNTGFNRNVSNQSGKRFSQQNEDNNQFDAFQPKRMRTFNENVDQQFYPDNGNFYPPSSTPSFSNYQANNNKNNYDNQWASPSDWEGQQQSSSNFVGEQQQYMNRMSTQPPLPNYDPPPLPSSSSSSSSSFHHFSPSQGPRFGNNFNQNTFRH